MKIKRIYERVRVKRSDLKPGDLFCVETNSVYIYMKCVDGAVCLTTGTYIKDSESINKDLKVIPLKGTLTVSIKQEDNNED